MYKLLIPLGAFMALGMFFTIITVDVKFLYEKTKTVAKGEKENIEKTLNTLRNTGVSNFIDRTEKRIKMSNIELYFPYNVWIHFLICLVSAAIFFNWISNYMNVVVSLVFSLIGLVLPYFILQLITDLINARIKKHTVDFLIILKNFTIATGNVFTALDKSKDFYIEPLKSYVGTMVYEYQHKVNPLKCMDNFIEKVQDNELKLFMENLKICYIHGGDIVSLIDEFINEISALNEDTDKEDAQDQIFKMGLYALLLLNFGVLYGILNSQYSFDITHTIYGNIIFILDIVISLYIGYMALDRVS